MEISFNKNVVSDNRSFDQDIAQVGMADKFKPATISSELSTNVKVNCPLRMLKGKLLVL